MEEKKFKKHITQDWMTEAGLRAVVLMTSMGHHCGYVAVPAGHPLHGVGYSDPCATLPPVDGDEPLGKRSVFTLVAIAGNPALMQSPEAVFNVHGGLTYSGGSGDYPVQNDTSAWWFGYDCGHYRDSPSPEYVASLEGERKYFAMSEGTFRDLDYNVAECESLARQIASVSVAA